MLKKILVPLDGSKLAEKALPHAEQLAEQFKAELILVHVMEPMLIMTDYGNAAIYNQRIWQDEAEMKVYLHGIGGELRERNIPTQSLVLKGGTIAESIIDSAYEKAVDLIVMSTHGRSGFSRWIHGSIATKVLQQAPCPVYLVRTSETQVPDQAKVAQEAVAK